MADVKVNNFGPQPAKILILGEAPGKSEVEYVDPQTKIAGRPFVGSSGIELTKMLNEAGILRSEVRVGNVCKFRPPGNKIEHWWPQTKSAITRNHISHDGQWFDPRIIQGLAELEEEVRSTRPNVIVPLGNLALWATTRQTGITKWRSSLLRAPNGVGIPAETKIIPTVHPAFVLRQWDWRYLAVHDLRRVKRWSDYAGYPEIKENFLVDPDYKCVVDTLEGLLRRLSAGEQIDIAADIETERRHIGCIGLAWSKWDALCIPFTRHSADGTFEERWTLDEETRIILLLRAVLTHRCVRVIGQNWQYDYQYLAKYWGFEVNLFLDIMSEHHVNFAGLAKSLDFQASLYQDIFIYWKDESKKRDKEDDLTWWRYNCKDCCATWEIAQVLLHMRNTTTIRGTEYGTPHAIQQRLSPVMARASARGVRKDHDLARRMAFVLQEDQARIHEWLQSILEWPTFNPGSPKQVADLFYRQLQQDPVLHRKTRKPTTDAEALEVIAKRDLGLEVLCNAIAYWRSLGNAFGVCLQATDFDGRFRCQFTIPGTETYRFSSTKDPFGFGGNGQNITSGDKADPDKPIPNLRQLFIPDPGNLFWDFDMPQADARVVAWEAEEPTLIELFRDPSRHLHMENAEILYGKRPPKNSQEYYFAKQAVHLSHYGGTAQVLARTLGITVREAEAFQRRYFQVRKQIPKWHQKIVIQLATKRYVENKYGYRRFYFDRPEGLLKEALAWIPQSTVAIATNLGILRVAEDEGLVREGVEFLLQVHDSSLFQCPTYKANKLLPVVLQKLRVTVPYSEPLVFEAGVKISQKSWGDCEEIKNVNVFAA